MIERRPSRSDSYQQIFHEISCSDEIIGAFHNEDGLYNRLNPHAYNEDLMDLEDELKVEFWRIVETLLTNRQREIIRLYADGYTQMEIAKKLGVNQSSGWCPR